MGTQLTSPSWKPSCCGISSAIVDAWFRANPSSKKFGGCAKTQTPAQSTISSCACGAISKTIPLARHICLPYAVWDIGLKRKRNSNLLGGHIRKNHTQVGAETG